MLTIYLEFDHHLSTTQTLFRLFIQFKLRIIKKHFKQQMISKEYQS